MTLITDRLSYYGITAIVFKILIKRLSNMINIRETSKKLNVSIVYKYKEMINGKICNK